jgi:hypothetical protein
MYHRHRLLDVRYFIFSSGGLENGEAFPMRRKLWVPAQKFLWLERHCSGTWGSEVCIIQCWFATAKFRGASKQFCVSGLAPPADPVLHCVCVCVCDLFWLADNLLPTDSHKMNKTNEVRSKCRKCNSLVTTIHAMLGTVTLCFGHVGRLR